ncbi:MAG TPA: prolyl oligopeptidase family serine peptidase [Caulobacteraceae bacterium]
MRLILAAAVAAFAGGAIAQTPPSATPGAVDPFAWLEDIHGARAMAWVEAQNKRTAARLESDPRYETFRREALALFTATDRIPRPGFLGQAVDNFWQDGAHIKGLWRRASGASYNSPAPAWETLIDLDALSKAEGRNWIFKGASCLPPADRLCLVRLSDGGGDAVELREFDTRAKAFVPGGFRFSAGKQEAVWLDADTLLIGRDFGPGTLTASGYPFIAKRITRGQPLSEATEVFRGEFADVSAGAEVLRGPDGAVEHVLFTRGVDFFSRRYWLMAANGPPRALDLPGKIDLRGYVDHRMIVSLNENWAAGPGHGAFKAGELIAFEPVSGAAELIFHPSVTQTVDQVEVTQNRVLVELLDNVNGALDIYGRGPDGWRARRLGFPAGVALSIVAADHASDRAYVSSESFLTPTALWAVDAAKGEMRKVKALPPRFDASRDVTEQHFATSKDGTRVPYWLVRPRAMKFDGSTPTQMFGYGGFLVSETPTYRPELGKLWLERGGAYVLANIRGGGEYGPAWHEAALREHRQRAFDDFAAVARDVIARKITSPRRLGIYGRSNGGVLVSVAITQHPELYNAAVIESPLIDMLRYTHLSAGASWAAEYGDPDNPADRAFIAAYSAYENLKPGVKYPEPYVTTNTVDDRVHPGHARKFAAALEALDDPVLFYENTFGGHANDADPELNARRWARHYVYLSQKLMD